MLLILLCGCDKKKKKSLQPVQQCPGRHRTDVSRGKFFLPRTVHQLHSPASCNMEFPSVSCNTWNKGIVTSWIYLFIFWGFSSLSMLEARNRSNQPTAGVHSQLNQILPWPLWANCGVRVLKNVSDGCNPPPSPMVFHHCHSFPVGPPSDPIRNPAAHLIHPDFQH